MLLRGTQNGEMDLLGQDLVGSSAPLGHWRGHTVATWTWRRRATGFQCASLVFQLFAGSELFRDVEGLRSKTQLRFSRSADVPGTGHDTQQISAGHLHQTTPEVKNRTGPDLAKEREPLPFAIGNPFVGPA